MKIWSVNYISPIYDDGPVAMFISEESAKNWIEYHIEPHDRQNYYVVEWDVHE